MKMNIDIYLFKRWWIWFIINTGIFKFHIKNPDVPYLAIKFSKRSP